LFENIYLEYNECMNELKISHEALIVAITEMAHSMQYRVARFRSVRVMRKDGSFYFATPVGSDGVGFLDLTMAKQEEKSASGNIIVPGRLIFSEIKVGKDKVRPEQQVWFDWLTATGLCEVYIWTDKDYRAGIIEQVLAGGKGRDAS
jgi:hypothetical protein